MRFVNRQSGRCHMGCEKAKGQCGTTLPEVMVSAAIGFVILAGMAIIFLGSSLGFAAMGNYINMDRSSRNALDRMTLAIRNSWRLVNFDPALMVFNYDNAGTINLTYRYDDTTGVLTEEWTRNGQTKTNTLLTGCDELSFTLCDRNSTPCADTSPGQGKVVSVAWKCSRSLIGKKIATEDMQQADIVIRNQP